MLQLESLLRTCKLRTILLNFRIFPSLQKIGLVLRPTIKVVDSGFSFPDSADQEANKVCWPDSGHNYIIRKKSLGVNRRSPSRLPSLGVAMSDVGRLYSETSCLLFLFCFFSEYEHHWEFLRRKKSHFRIFNEVFQLSEILLVFGRPTPLIKGPGVTKSVFFVFLNLRHTSFARQEE